jgi:hypothetical protein
MGLDGSQIVGATDQRSGIISCGELAQRIIPESGLKRKPWFRLEEAKSSDNAELMGPDGSQIVGATDQRSGIISCGELAQRIIPESGLKRKPWFRLGTTWRHWVHFEVISGLSQTISPRSRNQKVYKGAH